MTKSKKHSRVMSIIIAVAMVFSVFVFMPEDVSAATKKPGKVKITKAIKMNQIITVKWEKTKNAKKYQIYLKEGKKKWKKVATVKASKRSYSIKRLKWNTKYQLKMRAINGKKKGKWSTLYKGKLDKKTTLEKSMNKKARADLKKLEKDLSNSTAKAKITVSGNTVVMRMDFIGAEYDYSDPKVLAGVKAEMEKTFKDKTVNKEMKKSITEIENDTGIFGVKIQLMIYDSAGRLLLNHTY